MPLNMRSAIDNWGRQARNNRKLVIANIIEGVARFRTQGHCSERAREIGLKSTQSEMQQSYGRFKPHSQDRIVEHR